MMLLPRSRDVYLRMFMGEQLPSMAIIELTREKFANEWEDSEEGGRNFLMILVLNVCAFDMCWL
jgi:hypothetical protein